MIVKNLSAEILTFIAGASPDEAAQAVALTLCRLATHKDDLEHLLTEARLCWYAHHQDLY